MGPYCGFRQGIRAPHWDGKVENCMFCADNVITMEPTLDPMPALVQSAAPGVDLTTPAVHNGSFASIVPSRNLGSSR